MWAVGRPGGRGARGAEVTLPHAHSVAIRVNEGIRHKPAAAGREVGPDKARMRIAPVVEGADRNILADRRAHSRPALTAR